MPRFGLIIDTNYLLCIRPILNKKADSHIKLRQGAFVQLFEQAGVQASLRERLCIALRNGIGSGSLLPLQRLPSSRLLAADLGMSRITVEAAYSQIEAEGYIFRQVGKGTFVSAEASSLNPNKHFPSRPDRDRARNSASHKIHQQEALSLRGTAIIETGGCYDPLSPLPFAAGSPDLRAFPHRIWRQLTNKVLRLKGENLMGYGDPQGYQPLRQNIARYLQQSRGVICEPDQLVITTSSQQALQLLATLLIDAGDIVWIEQPGYLGARNAFLSAGANLQPIPVDAHGMNFAGDYRTPRLISLTPSHHYPTGVSLSLPRRLALLEFAARQQSWIVEDDYDSELHYDGRPLPAMQGLDKQQRVIYLGTFSKVLFPSLRVAYMVLPPQLIEPMTRLRTVFDGHTAQIMQAVTAEFIEQGHFAAHLRNMRQLYHSRRDFLLAQINQKLEWMTPLSAKGGLQLAVNLPHGQEELLTRQAQQLGVITPGLSALHLPQKQPQHPPQHSPQYLSQDLPTEPPNNLSSKDGWLLGFSALNPVEITSAIDRLSKIKP